ncbi:MAG: DUF937 domain-containing protein [Deltaproteobacteria bacterium]|nr:DUF937 domain-containing protein [Deltaproteobacteria bacterium]
MGLLDQVLGQALGSLAGGGAKAGANGGALVEGVMEMLAGQQGGIDGLAKQFQQAGLGDAMASWVSTGKNQAISPADLTKALGQWRIDALAQRGGVPQGQGASVLAQLLPVVIDQLTPQGKAPAQNQLGQLGAQLLKGLVAGRR